MIGAVPLLLSEGKGTGTYRARRPPVAGRQLQTCRYGDAGSALPRWRQSNGTSLSGGKIDAQAGLVSPSTN